MKKPHRTTPDIFVPLWEGKLFSGRTWNWTDQREGCAAFGHWNIKDNLRQGRGYPNSCQGGLCPCWCCSLIDPWPAVVFQQVCVANTEDPRGLLHNGQTSISARPSKYLFDCNFQVVQSSIATHSLAGIHCTSFTLHWGNPAVLDAANFSSMLSKNSNGAKFYGWKKFNLQQRWHISELYLQATRHRSCTPEFVPHNTAQVFFLAQNVTWKCGKKGKHMHLRCSSKFLSSHRASNIIEQILSVFSPSDMDNVNDHGFSPGLCLSTGAGSHKASMSGPDFYRTQCNSFLSRWIALGGITFIRFWWVSCWAGWAWGGSDLSQNRLKMWTATSTYEHNRLVRLLLFLAQLIAHCTAFTSVGLCSILHGI